MADILQGKKFKCAFCKGTGVQLRSLKSRCLACRGKGEVEFENPIKCPSCQGIGKTSPSSLLSCIHCQGVGVIEKSEKAGEKRLKPIKPFVKEIKKETAWLEKLGNKIKNGWQSLWQD
jgi:DnaJ-class molecular chaperone